MVEIAGVSRSSMPVSQTSAMCGPQLGRVRLQERHQRRRPALLLALEQDRQPARQPPGHRLPGAHRLEEGHQLALVVRRPAAEDHLARAPRRRSPDRTAGGPRGPAGRPAARRSARRTGSAARPRRHAPPPSDARAYRGGSPRSRSRAGRAPASRPRRGRPRHRPGRSRCSRSAAARTAGPAPSAGRRRYGRGRRSAPWLAPFWLGRDPIASARRRNRARGFCAARAGCYDRAIDREGADGRMAEDEGAAVAAGAASSAFVQQGQVLLAVAVVGAPGCCSTSTPSAARSSA